MIKDIKYFAIPFIWLILISTCFSQKVGVYNDEQLCRISVMLYQEKDSTPGRGTGTILYYNNKYYLLTASHVANKLTKDALVVFNIGNNKSWYKEISYLTNKKPIWNHHENADIAIARLDEPKNQPLKNIFKLFAFSVSQVSDKKDIPPKSTEAFFFGYPVLDINTLENFSTISISGRIVSGLFSREWSDAKKVTSLFYLSEPSLGGCSGSGVYLGVYNPGRNVRITGSQTTLIGVIRGNLKDNKGSKLASVTPSYYIFDLLK